MISHYLKRTNKIILIQESSQQWWNTLVSNIRWASWNRDQPLLATVRGFLKDRFLLSEAGSPIHEALISYTWNSNWNCACAVIKGSFRCWVSSQFFSAVRLAWLQMPDRGRHHLLLPPKSNLPFKCSDNQEKPQRPVLPLLYAPLHTHTAVSSTPWGGSCLCTRGEKHLTGREKREVLKFNVGGKVFWGIYWRQLHLWQWLNWLQDLSSKVKAVRYHF